MHILRTITLFVTSTNSLRRYSSHVKMDALESVLNFWFVETDKEFKFKKDVTFDKTITERFGSLHTSVCNGDFDHRTENASDVLIE